MSIHLAMVTVDSRDPRALAQWWAQQLGGTLEAYGETGLIDPNSDEAEDAFFVVSSPDRLSLGFQKVPEPTEGKNRLHLDLQSDNRAESVALFVEAGATLAYEMSFWTTLADPDGNLFCISDQA